MRCDCMRRIPGAARLGGIEKVGIKASDGKAGDTARGHGVEKDWDGGGRARGDLRA